MGIAITIGLSALLCLVAALTRPIVALYLILFIYIFFKEAGEGFTSLNGSFFFNATDIDFFLFKAIEIITAAAYVFVLFSKKFSNAGQYLRSEKILAYLFIILIVFLSFFEYFLHGRVTVSDWRFMVSGLLLFHMLYMLIESEEGLMKFAMVLLLMLGVSALIGLLKYIAGYGIESPRGNVPFFWDSRQIDAFSYGAIMVFSYLITFKGLKPEHRILSRGVAAILFAILAITVLLSMRRTLWMVLLVGILLSLLASPRVNSVHYLALALAIVTAGVAIMTLPVFDAFRSQLATHVDDMNVLKTLDKPSGQQQRETVMSNIAHVENIAQYSRIIMNEPIILYLGFRGRSGSDYNDFKADMTSSGPLGTAHNGLLRSIQGFGFVGLLLYLALFLGAIFQWNRVLHLPSNSLGRIIASSSLIFLFLSFLPTLSFTPPFYNSLKGILYIFLALFFLRASLYFTAKPDDLHQGKIADGRAVDGTASPRYPNLLGPAGTPRSRNPEV